MFALYCMSCFNSEFLLCKIINVILHVTLWPCGYLFDDCDLSEVSSCATLDERDVCCQAHPIHMITSGYGGKWCLVSVISICWLFEITFLSSEVKFEYLCYLKRSSPTQTSWRTPHCSQGCWGKITNFQLKQVVRNNENQKYIQYILFNSEHPW